MDIEPDQLTVEAQEIRSHGPDRPVAVTATWSAPALQAVAAALSEQLARLGQDPVEDADQMLVLRHQTLLAERFADHASAGAHALLAFDDTELSVCANLLNDYLRRVDGDDAGYQPPELREQLRILRLVQASLCEIVSEARAAAVAAREHAIPR